MSLSTQAHTRFQQAGFRLMLTLWLAMQGTKKVDSSSGSTSQSLVKPGQHKAHEAEGAVKRSADDQHSYSTDMPDVNLPQADCVKQNTTTTVQEVAVGTEEPCQQEGSPAVQIDAKSSDEAVCTADAQSTATEQSPSNCVFFARVPPTVPYESIHALFSQFGKVLNLNLFRPWASAKTSKVSMRQGMTKACHEAGYDKSMPSPGRYCQLPTDNTWQPGVHRLLLQVLPFECAVTLQEACWLLHHSFHFRNAGLWYCGV